VVTLVVAIAFFPNPSVSTSQEFDSLLTHVELHRKPILGFNFAVFGVVQMLLCQISPGKVRIVVLIFACDSEP
jgi:hypothetical protein